MKRLFFLCLFLLVSMTGLNIAGAATPCSSLGTRLSAAEITNAFKDQLICAQKMGAISGNDRWSEEHRASGELWEQGRGTTSKIHPPTKVGAWKAVEVTKGKGKGEVKSPVEDLVRYDYSGGSSFSWSVYEKNVSGTKTYTFCDSTETKVIATATIKAPNPSSTNACGF
ncbi:MAG: hypothetical protein FJ143_04270 [Deltaproteobacteria bacterium]|nr:hypothetical protein [Deltaproteobacteria bacterium]